MIPTTTINVLWRDKRYIAEIKLSWWVELDLSRLTSLSLLTPLKQAQKTANFLYKTWKRTWSFLYKKLTQIKEKIIERKSNQTQMEFWEREKRYRNLNDFQKQRSNKKDYYKPKQTIQEIA